MRPVERRWPNLLHVDAPRLTSAALWVGGWLRATAAPDDVLGSLPALAPDAPAVARLDGAPPVGLAELLGHLRAQSATQAWLLLPRPGRTLGWPAKVTGTPVPAILVSAAPGLLGMLRHDRAGWAWDSVADDSALAVVRAGMLSARAAARSLAEVVTDAAADLERLGLDRAATRRSAHAWQGPLDVLPRGLDPQVAALVTRIAVLRDSLELALVEDGAAVTAAEARTRAARIRAVTGEVEDVLAGVVGGLNAPRVAPGGPNTAPVP